MKVIKKQQQQTWQKLYRIKHGNVSVAVGECDNSFKHECRSEVLDSWVLFDYLWRKGWRQPLSCYVDLINCI